MNSTSPLSISAPCPHFDLCGGCMFQDVPPDIYCTTKIESVTQTLGAILNDTVKLHPPVFIPQSTRRRVTFVAAMKDSDVQFGFHQKRSHAIVDVSVCLLLTPRLEKIRQNIRSFLPRLVNDHQSCDLFFQEMNGEVELVITGPVRSSNNAPDTALTTHIAKMADELHLTRVGWRAKEVHAIQPIVASKTFTAHFGKLDVHLPFQTFLQPSAQGEAALVDRVLSYLPKIKKTRAADLFCGCGTFSGPLLDHVAQLYAADNDVAAINALRLATKGLAHVTVEQRDLEKEPLTLREMKNLDVIVFDPARLGAKNLAQKIAVSNVPVVIGVSCNPQTFARDAGALIKGGYQLTDLAIIDQFIWSSHVELVARFEKK